MYTVLILLTSESSTQYNVAYFQTKKEAYSFNPTGENLEIETIVYEKFLTADEAIAEYLD